eukprot:351450-Chlamydomonas_euryale.AAC.2
MNILTRRSGRDADRHTLVENHQAQRHASRAFATTCGKTAGAAGRMTTAPHDAAPTTFVAAADAGEVGDPRHVKCPAVGAVQTARGGGGGGGGGAQQGHLVARVVCFAAACCACTAAVPAFRPFCGARQQTDCASARPGGKQPPRAGSQAADHTVRPLGPPQNIASAPVTARVRPQPGLLRAAQHLARRRRQRGIARAHRACRRRRRVAKRCVDVAPGVKLPAGRCHKHVAGAHRNAARAQREQPRHLLDGSCAAAAAAATGADAAAHAAAATNAARPSTCQTRRLGGWRHGWHAAATAAASASGIARIDGQRIKQVVAAPEVHTPGKRHRHGHSPSSDLRYNRQAHHPQRLAARARPHTQLRWRRHRRFVARTRATGASGGEDVVPACADNGRNRQRRRPLRKSRPQLSAAVVSPAVHFPVDRQHQRVCVAACDRHRLHRRQRRHLQRAAHAAAKRACSHVAAAPQLPACVAAPRPHFAAGSQRGTVVAAASQPSDRLAQQLLHGHGCGHYVVHTQGGNSQLRARRAEQCEQRGALTSLKCAVWSCGKPGSAPPYHTRVMASVMRPTLRPTRLNVKKCH